MAISAVAINPVNNLPRELTPLIGREADADALRALLLDPAVPLITLTGPGGMGKTTLALHVAGQLLDHFPDGVHFIDLTPLSDPGLIPAQIAQALDLETPAGQPLEETLADYYRQKKALLLLDNFEHLIDGAGVAADLLRHSAHLKILVTSRESLRLRGEQLYTLPPLTLPDTRQVVDVEALLRIAAVDLFVQRARAVRPGFVLAAENALAVAGIVARLDGLPLAIELAAARVRMFPPAALLARLAAPGLGMLVDGARDLPQRQRTIRATIGWSVDLLEPPDERLFRRLGVFANGFTIEAAEAVAATAFADDIDVPVGLESLLDKSLITRLPVEEEPRFGLLETLRAYALEQLTATGEEPTARRAHFDHYLALAEASHPHFRGPDQAAWIARLAAEEDNLRVALDWALDSGLTGLSGVALGVQLAGALGQYWNYGGRHLEGKRQLERALLLVTANEPVDGLVPETDRPRPACEARALSAAGTMMWQNGDYPRALALHEQALAAYTAAGDEANAADSRHNAALQLVRLGDYSRSRVLLAETIEFYRRVDRPGALASSLNSLGLVYSKRGDAQNARLCHEEALAAARRAGYQLGIAFNLINLAQVELRLGNLPQAEALLTEAGSVNTAFIDMGQNIDLTLAWGRLREMRGDAAGAGRAALESLRPAHERGHRIWVADALEQLAFALHLVGQSKRGARLLGAAAALRERMGAADVRDHSGYYAERLPLVQDALGETAFAAEWAAGRALSRDEAVARAMEEPAAVRRPPTAARDTAPSAVDPLAELTPRERDVALLMIRGLTNEAIGRELFISINTVEKHAGNALGKLGLRNRMELARWIAAGSPPLAGA